MPNAKHTPGPWIARHSGYGDAEVVADCGWKNYDPTILRRGTWEDAKLIAAAPELLRACQHFMECITPDGLSKCKANDEDFVRGRAAIAKATSGQTG